MVRENPLTLPIAALGALVPLFTLGNYVLESCVARWWMARHMQSRKPRSARAIAEVMAC